MELGKLLEGGLFKDAKAKPKRNGPGGAGKGVCLYVCLSICMRICTGGMTGEAENSSEEMGQGQ